VIASLRLSEAFHCFSLLQPTPCKSSWLSTPDLNPSDTELSAWTVTFAQTTNGTSATPKFNQTSASSNVMHVGGICTNGIF